MNDSTQDSPAAPSDFFLWMKEVASFIQRPKAQSVFLEERLLAFTDEQIYKSGLLSNPVFY